MASTSRLARTIQWCRTIASRKTLAPPSPHLPLNFKYRSFYHHIHTNPSRGYPSESSLKIPKYVSAVPGVGYDVVAVVAVLGLLSSVNYTEAFYVVGNQDAPLPTESPWTYVDMEATAKNERERLEELLKSKGMQHGSYPRFTVDVKGQKVTIKFPFPTTREVPPIFENLVSRLGKPCGLTTTTRFTLGRPKMQKETAADLCILITFQSLIFDKREVQFSKQGSFTTEELELLAFVLQSAGPN